MIELPDFARYGSVDLTLVDAGFTQNGLSVSSRIDRKGTRYRAECSFGHYYPEQGRQMVADLIRGKQEGIRIAVPLQHNQGSAGSPVVDGAVSTGRTLAIRGLVPGYACKKGFWLSVVVSGQHYLHNVYEGGQADATGDLSVTLNEQVRVSIPDGATIHLTRPMIEGIVTGDEASWRYSVDRAIPIVFGIKEAR